VLGALLAPTLLRRRPSAGSAPTPAAAAPAPIAIETTPAVGSTIFQGSNVVVIPADVARCTSCDAPLLRAGARFCADCGAAQQPAQVAQLRRIFCDQCGRPMRDGAHFCAHCGTSTPVQGVRG
jgi:hypothetical protein